jgi:hypothetical protein
MAVIPKRTLGNSRVKRVSDSRNDRQRSRSLADVGRMFDDLYTQLDLELTRMAQIQLQFDTLRSKIRLL